MLWFTLMCFIPLVYKTRTAHLTKITTSAFVKPIDFKHVYALLPQISSFQLGTNENIFFYFQVIP